MIRAASPSPPVPALRPASPRKNGLAAAGHEVDLDLAFSRQGSTPRLESPEGDPTTGTLVNVSRGSVVDDPALTALPDVTLYPHHASGTEETRGRMAQLTRDNLDAFFAGRPLPAPIAVFVPAASLARMTVPLLTNPDARRLFLDRHLLLGQGSGPAREGRRSGRGAG